MASKVLVNTAHTSRSHITEFFSGRTATWGGGSSDYALERRPPPQQSGAWLKGLHVSRVHGAPLAAIQLGHVGISTTALLWASRISNKTTAVACHPRNKTSKSSKRNLRCSGCTVTDLIRRSRRHCRCIVHQVRRSRLKPGDRGKKQKQ